MKDYTLKKEDKSKFILSYDTDGDKIIIDYADGRSFSTKYSIELEKSILEIMKNQVLGATDFRKKQIKKVILIFGICGVITLSLFLALIDFIFGSKVVGDMIPLFLLEAFGGSIALYKTEKISKNINDYDKNIKFIENMDLIYEGLDKEMGTYLDVNEKTEDAIYDMIDQIEETKDKGIKMPNLNTIDEIGYSSMKDIIDCVNKNNEVKGYVKKKELVRK